MQLLTMIADFFFLCVIKVVTAIMRNPWLCDTQQSLGLPEPPLQNTSNSISFKIDGDILTFGMNFAGKHAPRFYFSDGGGKVAGGVVGGGLESRPRRAAQTRNSGLGGGGSRASTFISSALSALFGGVCGLDSSITCSPGEVCDPRR